MFVGTSKENLQDRVCPDLPLSPVMMQFGKYMKVLVVLGETNREQACTSIVRRNAFEVMTMAQKQASQKRIPQVLEERNRKDKLYNHLQSYCEKKELTWKAEEVNTLGVSFLKSLCDVLWYIDGHQHVFASRGCPIPDVLAEFHYNTPELSKHRKRAASNMTCDELEALASKLFEVLQLSFLHRPRWVEMKANLETLAHSLSKYSNMLREKSKTMKLVHTSSNPWRSLSKGLDLFYLASIANVALEEIRALNTKVVEAGPYQFLDLNDYAPSESKKRYHFIKELKNGIGVPAILLVYSPGNNVGNSHFIWHVPDSSLDEAIKNSQTVIEEIKVKLPVFHSRLMKKAFISKFGRVSSAVKPAVLRYFYHDLTGDCSASETLSQEELYLRVKQAIEMEDPEIVTDLRHLNSGMKAKYDVFWDECSKLLEQKLALLLMTEGTVMLHT